MIPTISTYLYRIHHEKAQMLLQMERRRSFLLLSALTLCVLAIVIILR